MANTILCQWMYPCVTLISLNSGAGGVGVVPNRFFPLHLLLLGILSDWCDRDDGPSRSVASRLQEVRESPRFTLPIIDRIYVLRSLLCWCGVISWTPNLVIMRFEREGMLFQRLQRGGRGRDGCSPEIWVDILQVVVGSEGPLVRSRSIIAQGNFLCIYISEDKISGLGIYTFRAPFYFFNIF